MDSFLDLYQQHFAVSLLVLSRIAGVTITAPLLSAVEIPLRFRAAIAVILALVAAPPVAATTVEPVATMPEFAVAAGFELLIGATLGLGVTLVLGAAQPAGHLISQLSGLS